MYARRHAGGTRDVVCTAYARRSAAAHCGRLRHWYSCLTTVMSAVLLLRPPPDCVMAKRSLRSLERTARRSGPLADTTSLAAQAWRAECRRYFSLIRQKRFVILDESYRIRFAYISYDTHIHIIYTDIQPL